MRVFDHQYLNNLEDKASSSYRKRAHLNLHGDFNEKVQRLFISLTKGSYVEPHYHELPHQWEMFVVIQGIVEVIFYASTGKEIKRLFVGEGQACKAIEIDPLDIHSVECISDKALMLEIKEGPFKPETAKISAAFLKS
ncbi:WbuC family cupin fold metalloprotein [Vibrio sp. ZSDZ34]|uniref:WbuC family cupin fold metalloprotein n=1 Tax=Vibrio gelatinilyticus TaxID=2893468 RepID=A0A9X1WFQ0_9VIBR|nr:WbuC family cupin fold metalloprotein [Vibrio gelatinilyticus]MCJ2378635.1 WbuC family cupin fold metalloprotein [Vibrio gelatinilyticus]